MMKYIFIFIFSIYFQNALFAIFYKGYIIDNQDVKIECFVEMFNGMDSKITYKIGKDEAKQKIKSTDLKEIGLYDDESKDTIIYKKYKAAGYAFGKKPKVYKDPIWAYEIHANDKVIAYYSPSAEVSHGGGNIRSWQVFHGYIKLRHNDFIVHVYETGEGYSDPFNAYDKNMRNLFLKSLEKTCPEMEDKVKKEKYKVEDFIKMLDDYSSICK